MFWFRYVVGSFGIVMNSNAYATASAQVATKAVVE